MNRLIVALSLSLSLAVGVWAQGKPVTPAPPVQDSVGKSKSASHYADAMKNLPPGVAEKISIARDAAKAAKDNIDAMKAQGKTAAEVQAMITEKRAAALLNLQNVLDALNGLPASVKERVTHAKDVTAKRLQEREAEAKPSP